MTPEPRDFAWMIHLDVRRTEERICLIRAGAILVFALGAIVSNACSVMPAQTLMLTLVCLTSGLVASLGLWHLIRVRQPTPTYWYATTTIDVTLVSVVLLTSLVTGSCHVALIGPSHAAYLMILVGSAIRFHVPSMLYTAGLTALELTIVSIIARIVYRPMAPNPVMDTLLSPAAIFFRPVFLLLTALLLLVLVRRAHKFVASLQDFEKVHMRMVNQVSDGFIVCSSDARIMEVNTAACELLDLSRNLLVELNATSALPGCLSTALEERWNEVLTEGFTAAQDLSIPTANHETRILDMVAQKLLYRKEHIVHIVLRDVTSQRNLAAQDAQINRLRALRAFAEETAHEFNNILASVEASSFILSEAIAESAPYYPEVKTIRNGTARATSLVRALVDLSDIRHVTAEPVILGRLLDKALATSHPANSPVQIIQDIAPDVKCILGDEGQIVRALSHLIDFAHGAMLDGGTLRITAKNHKIAGHQDSLPPGDYVEIGLSDTGIGMPRDVAAKAFDFVASKPGRHGLGFALPNAHSIIARHGGSIQLHSSVGQGTVFTVRFPATEPTSDKASTGESTRPPASNRRPRLLVVDDEPANRTSLARLLSMRGYEVLLAEDGPCAVRLCESQSAPFDLVLLDLLMPGMNGKDVLVALRQRFPKIKVLMVTGYADQSLIEEALASGATGVTYKPFNVPDLLEKVKKLTASASTSSNHPHADP